MTENKYESNLDLSEKGREKDGTPVALDRRLFMQFMAFGDCGETVFLIDALEKARVEGVLYADINDPNGIGLLTLSENPDFFVGDLRDVLNKNPFTELAYKPEYTMLGRTYSLGYEPDLEEVLLNKPRKRLLNPELCWHIWYPLRRAKEFETLADDKKRKILGEHGKVGFRFGKSGFAKDIRLACHGLDKNDNDFVIGLLGKELYPLSKVVEAMRKTEQTSQYLESLGPFFIGKAIWQSSLAEN